MSNLNNLIERLRMISTSYHPAIDEAADALESQAREIEELKADATERNADHGKLVEENHELRAALESAKNSFANIANASQSAARFDDLRQVAYNALTRCKEVLNVPR
jgi:hypothetical protein